MHKMFNWLKEHKMLTVVLSIIIILGIPFLIHCIFKIDSGMNFFKAEWSAGDALEYYGNVLSFIGTVVLGVLALYQNKIIKDETDKRTELLENKEREANMPRFFAKSRGCNGACARLKFDINNYSDNPASNIELFDIKILDTYNNKEFWNSKKAYSKMGILAGGKVEFELDNPSVPKDGFVFIMSMSCEDKYNIRHNYRIEGVYNSISLLPKLTIKEI